MRKKRRPAAESAAVQTGRTFSTENRATPAKEHRAMTSSKNSIAMWKTNLPSSALPNAMSFRLAAHPPPLRLPAPDDGNGESVIRGQSILRLRFPPTLRAELSRGTATLTLRDIRGFPFRVSRRFFPRSIRHWDWAIRPFPSSVPPVSIKIFLNTHRPTPPAPSRNASTIPPIRRPALRYR